MNLIAKISFLFLFLCAACSVSKVPESSVFLDNRNLTSGETIVFDIEEDKIIKNASVYLTNVDSTITYESYKPSIENSKIIVSRFLNTKVSPFQKYNLLLSLDDEDYSYPVNIEPSVIITKLCSTENCTSFSGNIVEGVLNNLEIETFKIAAVSVEYLITTPYNIYNYNHEFNSPTNTDSLRNIVLDVIPEDTSSYIATIDITVFDVDGKSATTSLPFRVVRPLEIKHFGKHEIAEIYEPVPVTGCIPGTVGSNVQYSESESETRQNSVSVTINKSWSDSFSSNSTQTISEGISVGETQSTINSSSMSSSETQSESITDATTESESDNVSFSTSDGENWSWSLGESNSQTQGQTQGQSTDTSVNGSTTIGVSGEGSLPFLAKASGKVEVSAGVSRGWGESSSISNSETSGTNRGYSTGGTSQSGRTYGSAQNNSRSRALSGAYVLSSTTSNSISESSSLSSSRVWNMSESLSSGKVITEGSGESVAQTIVNSSSSTTTFSYSGYIPRGRFGVFFRQTSRYVKISEIITYNLNGYPQHAGYIMMNTWAWAPELSVAESCSSALTSNLPLSECLIPPCGE